MWARKRIDIGWADLVRAAAYTVLPLKAPVARQMATPLWPGHGGVVSCLTERSGLDLLLGTLAWPPGSEVLVSAVTIHDMVRIIEQHGLVAVPIDIDERDMSPRMESIERAVTSQTRAILVAHLFGGIFPTAPIVEWAERHGVLVLEDCAQAFDGRYAGHPQADVVMFSFGPIKTATALGGGLMRINHPDVCRRVRELHATWPGQSRAAFLKRVLTYSVLKLIGGRLAFRLFVSACRMTRRDHDSLLNAAVRNLPEDFFGGLRQRPSPPLLRLMHRRIRLFDRPRLERRAARGRLLARMLDKVVDCPGSRAETHSFWLFPAKFDDCAHVIASLRRFGFDAAVGGQLHAVVAPKGRETLDPIHARAVLSSSVCLPVYPEMPEREVERLGQVLLETVRQVSSDLP